MMPLVLIHGYPFNRTIWSAVISKLDWDGKVLTPDLPGFGDCPASKEEPALEKMAEHVRGVLDAEGIDRAVVCGFSMGGYVSLALIERYAGRVAALGLINSQPFADSDDVRAGRRTMIEKVRKEGPKAASDAALPKLFAQRNTSDPELTRFAIEGADKAGVAGITWALEAMARRPDRTQVLDQFGGPKLLVHSTEDRFIPIDKIRKLASMLTNNLYVEIPEAGHCTPLEAPEMVANAMRRLGEMCS